MDTNMLAAGVVLGLQEKAPRNRVWKSAVVVAGLILTLGGASSWGQAPPNNDVSDARENTAGGTNALVNNTTGCGNTAFGWSALASNTTACTNTAFGDGALQNNTTGAGDTAIGTDALQLNTTTDNNTAVGGGALQNNTAGGQDTAIGAGALTNNTSGNGAVAVGVGALFANTTGRINTAVGYIALPSNTTGSENTVVGFNALASNATGSDNIAVGHRAGADLTSGDNNIYLGNTGATTESDTMRLGQDQTSTFIAGITGTPLKGSTAQPVYITSDGQLGIKVSSARYKRDIHDMGERSHELLRLRPVTFRYKQDAQGQRQYGLIAEEVAKVYPELVVRGAKGEIESVQYEELTPMLLNELQHQQQELAELKAQNARLQAALVQQNAALAARLAQLEEVARVATVASR